MKNKVILFIVGITVLFGLIAVAKPSSQKQVADDRIPTAAKKTISISQTIVLSPTKTTSETVSVDEGKTALDALKSKMKIQTKGEGENAFVTTINDVEAKERKKQYWAFFVNGKPSEVGAGSYKLKDGDKIEWKLENY